MDMTGEYKIAAPRERVWAALNDPEILRQAIPGCEELNKLSDTELEATAKAKIGPVSARFKGKVVLSDLKPPEGYTLTGEGSGGAAGFAKGEAKVSAGRRRRRRRSCATPSRRRSAASSRSSVNAWSTAPPRRWPTSSSTSSANSPAARSHRPPRRSARAVKPGAPANDNRGSEHASSRRRGCRSRSSSPRSSWCWPSC